MAEPDPVALLRAFGEEGFPQRREQRHEVSSATQTRLRGKTRDRHSHQENLWYSIWDDPFFSLLADGP